MKKHYIIEVVTTSYLKEGTPAGWNVVKKPIRIMSIFTSEVLFDAPSLVIELMKDSNKRIIDAWEKYGWNKIIMASLNNPLES